MAKANMVLPDGTTVTIEGTADEVAVLLSKCSQSGTPSSGRGATPKSGRKRTAKREKGSGKRKSGPTAYITELVDEKYFKSKRTLGDIQKKLEEHGHIYAQTSLSPILTRLTRKRTLRRLKEKKGWVYVS